MQHTQHQNRNSYHRALSLAFALAAVAGCVDSVAFLFLHGFFASFMSGNSTRLAIGLAGADPRALRVATGLIVLFVAGVIVGSLIAAPRRVLSLVAALLLAAASASLLPHALAQILPMLFSVPALGAMNTVVQRAGTVSVTPTYITGTLVRMAQGLAAGLRGGPRLEWLPYALLWASLMAGAVIGATLFPHAGLRTLWLPAASCALLALLRPPPSPD